ncbi:MAG TPA: UvrB/UvrC motif-containing protein [Treponemataceae bacterium]|jgi:protein arginine kinase activator|nr:UvrB/UvrC motif-containing protein [Treponemataceae bacterium]
MKCDVCKKNEAIIFVRNISGQLDVELHLCHECAKTRNVAIPGKNKAVSLSSLLSAEIQNALNYSPSTKLCSSCGQSALSLSQTKRAGCAHCYTSLKKEILSLLKNENIHPSYIGSISKQHEDFSSNLHERLRLQSNLERAVESEDYEQAAYIRDKLKILEEEAFSKSSGAEKGFSHD